MRYDVEADWKLLYTCNFRCGYCFIPANSLGGKIKVFAEPAAWRRAFNATGRTWLLHITGGEPSVYPAFVDICAQMTAEHYISLNSNLTHAAMARFAQRIDPRRVSFINAGLHLEERETRGGHEPFLRHADLLRSKGFAIFVSVVATPAALARFEEAVALLAPIGLYPIPKLLRDTFEGRAYPQAYTAQDRARFERFAALAREFYAPALAARSERPSIDMFGDEAFLSGTPSYEGRLCEAGSRFVSIEPNGDVVRCSTQTALGNLLKGAFAPLRKAEPCDTQYCFYFCQKYAAPA